VEHLKEFMEFLSIPSIGTMPEHREDTQRAAEWVKARMEKAGIQDVVIAPTKGNPSVLGKIDSKRADAPTVLIYGHYDVQPPDPLEQWLTPPFEPTVRDGKIFARGATDDKGGVYGAIIGVEECQRQGGLPVNLRFLFEGEEESGSPNLPTLLADYREFLLCDLGLSVDGINVTPEVPGLITALKGACGIEVELSGPAVDQHSGLLGGVIQNPLNAMAHLIAGMKNSQGRITVAGFYDDVLPLTEEERAELAKNPFGTDEYYKELAGVSHLFGEEGYTALENNAARPTLDVNGLWGGFQGQGTKTVIPAKAHCKITCRLVPNQTPEKIVALLTEHVMSHVPVGVRAKVTPLGISAVPYHIPLTHPAVQAVAKVLKALYKTDPVEVRLGGSVPAASALRSVLGADLVTMYTGSPDANVHSPNEFFRLEELEKLRLGIPMLLNELAKVL